MSDLTKQEKTSDKEVNTNLHELLLKQQTLLLQQSDYISKANYRNKEEDDKVDLSVLIPGFLKRKKREDDDQSEDGTDIGFIEQQFNLVFRYRLLLLAFFGMGVFYTVGFHYVKPKVYQSTMTIASGFFDNTYYANLLYPLENLSESNSYQGLSKTLNLDTSITQNLINIKYRDFLSKDRAENENDSTLEVINRPYFKIDVIVSDNAMLSDLQDGIFNYLNNNIYVKKQLDIKRITLNRSVEELKKEALWLDTLKIAVIRSLTTGNGNDGSVSFTIKDTENAGEVLLNRDDKIKVEAVELFNKSQELGKKIIKTEGELMQLTDNLRTVSGFAANSKPLTLRVPSIGLNALYSLLLGLVVIYSIALLRYLRMTSG